MAREDAGNYGGKHPGEEDINPEIAEKIWKLGENNEIACGTAHRIAEDLDVPPEDVGQTVDLMEWKIMKCQLGLFGYGKGQKLVKKLESVPEDLEKIIRKRAPKGSLSCLDIWEAAREAGVTKLEAACAVETLELKIHDCQLGAFK